MQRIDAKIQRGVKCAEDQHVLNGAYVVFKSFVDLVLGYCTGVNFILHRQGIKYYLMLVQFSMKLR